MLIHSDKKSSFTTTLIFVIRRSLTSAIEIVKDELVALLGGDYVPLETDKNPTILKSNRPINPQLSPPTINRVKATILRIFIKTSYNNLH